MSTINRVKLRDTCDTETETHNRFKARADSIDLRVTALTLFVGGVFMGYREQYAKMREDALKLFASERGLVRTVIKAWRTQAQAIGSITDIKGHLLAVRFETKEQGSWTEWYYADEIEILEAV